MKKALLFSSVILIILANFSCSTFGTVSKSYQYSKPEIWYAMTTVVDKNYSGIKKIIPNPPTMISNLSVKDKKFGIDKTAYQVYASLSGFSRPFVVDVDVRAYPSGDENGDFSTDRDKAQEVIDQIEILLEHRKYNASLQDEYLPY